MCNNCGNRFLASQVELIKGGCNPVPITRDQKTEDANFITIPKALFEEAKPLVPEVEEVVGGRSTPRATP